MNSTLSAVRAETQFHTYPRWTKMRQLFPKLINPLWSWWSARYAVFTEISRGDGLHTFHLTRTRYKGYTRRNLIWSETFD